MPRHARLDAPGTLHHVIIRGLERGAIVRDAGDRAAFVTRLGTVTAATATPIYAWALLPNHAHLLLRSGPAGLPRFMRRLLTGDAGTFNRCHKRVGHLFQNRYQSIVVEEEAYFRELVRYLHLNPLRANRAATLRALDRYPWSGHATVLGQSRRAWQDRRTVRGWFGPTAGRAGRAYRAYVRAGIPRGRRPELGGGGLVRSAGGVGRSAGAPAPAGPPGGGSAEPGEQRLRRRAPAGGRGASGGRLAAGSHAPRNGGGDGAALPARGGLRGGAHAGRAARAPLRGARGAGPAAGGETRPLPGAGGQPPGRLHGGDLEDPPEARGVKKLTKATPSPNPGYS